MHRRIPLGLWLDACVCVVSGNVSASDATPLLVVRNLLPDVAYIFKVPPTITHVSTLSCLMHR